MKISNQISKIFLLALFALTIFSCDSNSDNNEVVVLKTSILDIAKADNDFSLLVAIVKKTGLDIPGVSPLSVAGSYTLFAPTNAAFAATPGTATLTVASVEALKTSVPAEKATIDFLKQVVLNHILSSGIRANDITTGYVKTFAQYNNSSTLLSMYIEKNGDVVKVNGGSTIAGGSVTKADINASNGIIHVVDRVLLPPSIVDHIKIAGCTTLLAVTASTATGAFGDQSAVQNALLNAKSSPTAATNPSLTVFAPLNSAFTTATTGTGYLTTPSFYAVIPPATTSTPIGANFTKVLQYHVSIGNLSASSSTAWVAATATANAEIKTLAPTDQKFSIEKGTVKITELPVVTGLGASVIKTANIQATNGMIHTIDRVLQPVL